MNDDRSFVVADVPGLIEGAHAGHGLGDRFLSHLERTKVLVHLVDVSSGTGRDPVADFEVITRELALFQEAAEPGTVEAGLAEKPQIVAATKMDALDEPERLDALAARLARENIPMYPISAVTGAGLPELLEAMWAAVAADRDAAAEPTVVLDE